MEKNACCIKNGKSMCDAFFFASRFNMMNKDFLKWFHHIPILQFFNTSSSLRSLPFLLCIVDSFLSTAKATFICGRSNVNNAIYEWNCYRIQKEKNVQTLLCAYLMNVCVSGGISFAYAFSFYATLLSLFFHENFTFCIWIKGAFAAFQNAMQFELCVLSHISPTFFVVKLLQLYHLHVIPVMFFILS